VNFALDDDGAVAQSGWSVVVTGHAAARCTGSGSLREPGSRAETGSLPEIAHGSVKAAPAGEACVTLR
jgi:hypothetical protein